MVVHASWVEHMKGSLRSVGGLVAITVASLGCAYLLEKDSGPMAGMAAVALVAMLGLLEVGFSFESAVVNARTLESMGLSWRWVSIAVGLLVSILGMRLVFPILLVWAVGDHGFWAVVSMIARDSLEFRTISPAQFILIEGFGGAFLCMAFTQFFLPSRKQEHWIPWLERPMSRLGRLRLVSVVATGTVSYLFSNHVPGGQEHLFLSAALLGIVMHLLMELVSAHVQASWKETLEEGARCGPPSSMHLASLVYLVLLGTIFSFGGVVGAFSLTSNLLIILLGLGVGAVVTQFLSLRLIPEIAPRSYRYLKHGVSWANGVLSLGLYLHAIESAAPDLLIGAVGTGLIGSSCLSSLRHRLAP